MDEKLKGKTFVVTGATSGIGLAVAGLLANREAFVIGVGRSAERCAAAEAHLQSVYPRSQVAFCVADLSAQGQVRSLAGEIRRQMAAHKARALDGLVNNAGTFTFRRSLTFDGIETQWAVNHLAPFLLTHELLPLLKIAPAARVVTVSSDSHYHTRLKWRDLQLQHGYNCLLAYQQTKLANVLFSAELNRRLGAGSSMRAFAADPGLVKTEIGYKGNPGLVRWIWRLRVSAGVPAERPAEGIVFLATALPVQDSPEIYWKDCQPKMPSRYALDAAAARRLWELSERMCGIPAGTYLE
ncbi:MAG TPA: SDR family NAD(P)-dependent oxidoreductase [Anaerolineales bacterium]|nr:SDR family NAD(P)-dependent oxidoreductase [Anaerolineales bacterium]